MARRTLVWALVWAAGCGGDVDDAVVGLTHLDTATTPGSDGAGRGTPDGAVDAAGPAPDVADAALPLADALLDTGAPIDGTPASDGSETGEPLDGGGAEDTLVPDVPLPSDTAPPSDAALPLHDALPVDDTPPPDDTPGPDDDAPLAADVPTPDDAAAGDDLAGPDPADTADVTLADVGPSADLDPGPVDAVAVPDAAADDASPLVDSAGADAVADAGADAPPYVWEPDGPCGMPPYQWLPQGDVGDLITWQELPQYRLTPELIALLLVQAGSPGVIQPQFGTRVYYVRYLTQDRGESREATALVGIPDLPATVDPATTFPVSLFLHPTVGYANACTPSDGLIGAAGAVVPASMGYVTVAPDLLGLCGAANPCEGTAPHPYLIGEPTAIAALDAVRAARKLLDAIGPEVGVAAGPQVVPWGGSQGGHAALFVDRYAPVYAPEIEIPCVVAMVPPSDMAGQASHAVGGGLSASSALGIAFLAAAIDWYAPIADPATLFNANGPKDYTTYIPQTYPTTCSAGALVTGAKSLDDLFAPDFLSSVATDGLAAVAPWGCIASEASLPSASVPDLATSEVLVILGENDELVDRATEVASVEALCGMGYRIELKICAGSDHVTTAVDTLSFQLDWVAACLNGVPIPEDVVCTAPMAESCK